MTRAPKHRLLSHFVVLASLVLAVTPCVLWAMSYVVMMAIQFGEPSFFLNLEASRGEAEFIKKGQDGGPQSVVGFRAYSYDPIEIAGWKKNEGTAAIGFGYLRVNELPSSEYHVLVPMWSITGALVALALLVITRYRHWRVRGIRERRGLCAVCGYDLRASRQRCPECGSTQESNSLSTEGAA